MFTAFAAVCIVVWCAYSFAFFHVHVIPPGHGDAAVPAGDDAPGAF